MLTLLSCGSTHEGRVEVIIAYVKSGVKKSQFEDEFDSLLSSHCRNGPAGDSFAAADKSHSLGCGRFNTYASLFNPELICNRAGSIASR